MLKIRLRRMGAIRRPHYRIVVADARAPRDGRFIESLGHYNPITDPATIQIDVAKYEEWKKKGAQPTDSVAGLVRQFNRQQRRAEATGQAVQPATPRMQRGAAAQQPAQDADATAGDNTADDVTEMSGPMNEAMAEATRDGGEGSDALIGASADAATSANPGAGSDEADTTSGS